MPNSPKRPVVLLAEDSEDDAFFFGWTLEKYGLECELVRANDGAEAVAVLKGGRKDTDGREPVRPDLVFLDLKMPAMTGFEVLQWIRDNPFNPPLDVAVLSGSEHAIDVARAKALGATGYYVKPLSVQHLRARFDAWREKHDPAAAAGGAAISGSVPAGQNP